MVLFIAELLFYTWSRVQCIRIGYEISAEAEKHENLMALQRNLKIELAHLKSPERIARIAKEELGLIMPGPEQLILLP
jgi:cell division protein FtsL